MNLKFHLYNEYPSPFVCLFGCCESACLQPKFGFLPQREEQAKRTKQEVSVTLCIFKGCYKVNRVA